MIGSTPPPVPRLDHAAGPVRLELRGLDLSAETPHATAVRGATLALHAGEILGIAGVAGNGQAELFAALSGERRTAPGAITMDGRPIGHLDPGRRRALGLCAVPEERNGHAAVLGFTLAENAFLTARHRRALARAGIIRPAAATRLAAEIIAAFGVRAPGPAATAADLSGGNLQKFVVGREILQSPTVLVVAQPTWGVDAGAAAAIHAALRRLAGSGAAILVLSQDLDELRALADRLAVIAGGVLSDARPIHAADTESIGLLMAGAPTPELADAAG